MLKKKRVMEIGISSRFITMNGKYRVSWGSTGNAYNRNRKSFTKRSAAIKFKNGLIKKYKKLGYTIEYMYIAD